MTNSVYKIVTDQILEQLKNGVIPWHKPWVNQGADISNYISKKPYTGINPFLLNGAGFACPYWVTFKQAKQLGGSVRKGEHGQIIVFFKQSKIEDRATGEEKNIPILRYYRVFNLDQCDGIDWQRPEPVRDHNPIRECELIVKSYRGKPEIRHGKDRACYSPSLDYVDMPDPEYFLSGEAYYSTLFHELGHSTGHKNRLNRDSLTSDSAYFGSHEYSKEELVAEFTAAMLCGVAGIEQATIENSAAYIQGWSRRLLENPKLIVQAAGRAQKAADLIRGIAKAERLPVAA